MIEQAKLTYSPSGKALENKKKLIEAQDRKQVEPTEEQGKQLVKSNAFAEKEKKIITLDKQKEIFHNLFAEGTAETEKLKAIS